MTATTSTTVAPIEHVLRDSEPVLLLVESELDGEGRLGVAVAPLVRFPRRAASGDRGAE